MGSEMCIRDSWNPKNFLDVGISTNLCRNLGSTLNLHKPQYKKQPQHTTTNMSRPRPTLHQLWPSISMATYAMDPNLGAATPYRPMAGTWRQVCARHCRLPCLGGQNATHQRTERPSFDYSKQQSTKSWQKRKGG